METTDIMTKYETASVIISIIAVVLSILIPLARWVWNRFIMKAKVNYYPTGQVIPYFNHSGSYLRLYGVLESERKAATIRKMRVEITRQLDEHKLKLTWSCFISPVNQSIVGNSIQTNEIVHPFRVEADSVACAFIEYSDPSDSSGIKIRKICDDLLPSIQQIIPEHSYEQARVVFFKSPEYIEAKNNLLSDFFWEIGKYSLDVFVEYGKQKNKRFSYEFAVSPQNSIDLRNDLDEVLISQLKMQYQKSFGFKYPTIEISERKA